MMTSTHIERYAEVGAEILHIKRKIKTEIDVERQGFFLVRLDELVRERNDLWDAIEFRVPEIT